MSLSPVTSGPQSEMKPHATRPSSIDFRTGILTAAVVLLGSFGNTALTWGMKHVPINVGLNPLNYIRAMLNPFVAAGIATLILWLLTRMALMSWADLSFVQPVTAVGYILAALLGKFFLNETVTTREWIGTFFIFAGASIVGTTAEKTTGPASSDPPA